MAQTGRLAQNESTRCLRIRGMCHGQERHIPTNIWRRQAGGIRQGCTGDLPAASELALYLHFTKSSACPAAPSGYGHACVQTCAKAAPLDMIANGWHGSNSNCRWPSHRDSPHRGTACHHENSGRELFTRQHRTTRRVGATGTRVCMQTPQGEQGTHVRSGKQAPPNFLLQLHFY